MNTETNTTQLILLMFAVCLVLYGAGRVLSAHDAAVEKAAQAYEACIKAEYHTTPANWYADHGVYPSC